MVGTLANQARTQHVEVDREWQEIFNSGPELYGGDNVGDEGQILRPANNFVMPANAMLVFRRI
ncbi:MAG TPA: alpha amylase C-terminal domain-containing protein [Thermoanaerobaculia bacterium]